MDSDFISEFIKLFFKRKPKQFSEVEEEIKEVLEDFKEERILSEFEEKLVLAFFSLKSLEVRNVVIPRNILEGLDISLSWQEIKKTVIQKPHSFYPIYKEILDNFLGYVSLKDLIKGFEENNFQWQEYIKPPLIIPENIPLVSALEKMTEKKVEVAFAVDEHSELTGIIRLKDIFKELLKTEQKCPHPDKEGWLILPGTFKLKDLEESLKIRLSKGDFETISGLIISHLGRIPKKGEKIKIGPLEIEIIKADERKIEIVKLKSLTSTENENSN
jgi:CBS domain containing-hemolysin-like protein